MASIQTKFQVADGMNRIHVRNRQFQLSLNSSQTGKYGKPQFKKNGLEK